jgi:hypothetical protein
MQTNLDLKPIDRLVDRFKRIQNPDATNLMLTWERILERSNREGILAGTDGQGNPLQPVTYRPKLKAGEKPLQLTAEQRLGRRANAIRGQFAGYGKAGGGLQKNNNLTSAEYRKLAGPPLAPRRQFSRAITNFKTDWAQLPSGTWQVTYWWEDVVSTKGVSFLKYHFEGTKKLPKRDLRGLRPKGKQEAQLAAREWMKDQVRTYA